MTETKIGLADRAVGADRLQTLVDHLKTVNPRRFYMASWAQVEKVNTPGKAAAEKIYAGECGTAACACGHAATIPEFRDLGLSLEKHGDDSSELSYNWSSFYTFVYRTKNRKRSGFEAASAFFKLTFNESKKIFDPCFYSRPSKYYVVRKLESQINKMRKEAEEW